MMNLYLKTTILYDFVFKNDDFVFKNDDFVFKNDDFVLTK